MVEIETSATSQTWNNWSEKEYLNQELCIAAEEKEQEKIFFIHL